MATKKDVPKDQPAAFDRKPTTERARRRNPVTWVDQQTGTAMKQLRTMGGLSLRDVAERMTVPPNGDAHYLVAVSLERIRTEGDSRDLDAAAAQSTAAARGGGASHHRVGPRRVRPGPRNRARHDPRGGRAV